MVKNKTGLKFGTLTILNEFRDEKNTLLCNCLCDCGNLYSVRFTSLNIGRSKCCPTCSLKFKKNGTKKHKENPLYKGYKDLPLTLFNSYKAGAKRRNFEFNISIKYAYSLYVIQNKKCYFTDIDLFLDVEKCNASLDRIDSNLGYVKGNLVWVYKPINLMKNDFEISYFIKMCCLISDFYSVNAGVNNMSKK